MSLAVSGPNASAIEGFTTSAANLLSFHARLQRSFESIVRSSALALQFTCVVVYHVYSARRYMPFAGAI